MRRFIPLLVTVALVQALACGRSSAGITLATTTSVGNSGLLDQLLPAFTREHRVNVQTHLVGSGRALTMLAAGQADVVISHAPAAETAAMASHPEWTYRKIMFNDFVLAGPPEDPARVKEAPDVQEAMRRIARADARFISRGDQSGTHEREQALWKAAGQSPAPGRLVIAGAGMGTTLRVASESGAYTLTDRATFVQNASSLKLVIVFEGSPLLLNTYSVIVNTRGPRAAPSTTFANWLSGGNGRDVLSRYRVGGSMIAFEPWPANRPAGTPTDLPR